MKCKLCNLPTDGEIRCPCQLTAKERSLPIWAQTELANVRLALTIAGNRCDQMEAAHSILQGRDWFILHGPHPDDKKPLRYLYWDICHPACSLGPEDVLLVGRREISQ